MTIPNGEAQSAVPRITALPSPDYPSLYILSSPSNVAEKIFSVSRNFETFCFNMRVQFFSRVSTAQWQMYRCLRVPKQTPLTAKHFHSSANLLAVKPFLLADIGEGKASIMC